jgi:hypothetical protein
MGGDGLAGVGREMKKREHAKMRGDQGSVAVGAIREQKKPEHAKLPERGCDENTLARERDRGFAAVVAIREQKTTEHAKMGEWSCGDLVPAGARREAKTGVGRELKRIDCVNLCEQNHDESGLWKEWGRVAAADAKYEMMKPEHVNLRAQNHADSVPEKYQA